MKDYVTWMDFYEFINRFEWMHRRPLAAAMKVQESKLARRSPLEDVEVEKGCKFIAANLQRVKAKQSGEYSESRIRNWIKTRSKKQLISHTGLAENVEVDKTRMSRWVNGLETGAMSEADLLKIVHELEAFWDGGETLIRKPVKN